MSEACFLCGSHRTSMVCRKSGFTYLRCLGCGLVRVSPLPKSGELAEYYRHAYDQFQFSLSSPSVEPHKARTGELRIVEEFSQKGKLLDVGCAYGHFLANARDHGWVVQGVEPQEESLRKARERFQLSVMASLNEVQVGAHDCITMWHVIEHIADPRNFLKTAASRLRKGGYLFLATPNMESIVAKATGASWGWLSPPDHLFLYSPRTLPRLATSCGLKIVEVRTRRGQSRNFLLLMMQALVFRLGLFTMARQSVRSAVVSTRSGESGSKTNWFSLAEKVTEVLSFPLYPFLWITWKLGLGDEIVLIARKED